MKNKFLGRNKITKSGIVGIATLSLVIGLAPMISQAATNGISPNQADKKYFAEYGWAVEDNSTPDFACSDASYRNAVKNGIKIGIYQALPFFDITNKGITGLDWDIHMAVMKYIGVKSVKTVTLQWPEMVPALLSKKIDVIGGNIHGNPSRYKNFAFTAPAWWYATVVVAAKGNPKGIKAWSDLKKPGLKLGAIAGSQAAAWLKDVNIADVSLFTTAALEFAALSAGRIDALVEDDPTSAVFIKTNPNAGVAIVKGLKDVPADVWANYARYGVRFQDCTLNFAYSRALSELIMHGVISQIVDKYGMSRTENIFEPEMNPAL